MKRVGPQPARPGRHGLEAAGWGGRWACGPAPVSSVGPRRSLPSRYSLLLLEFEFPPLKKTPRGDPGGAEGLAASGSTSVVPWDLTRTLLGSEDTGRSSQDPKSLSGRLRGSRSRSGYGGWNWSVSFPTHSGRLGVNAGMGWGGVGCPQPILARFLSTKLWKGPRLL